MADKKTFATKGVKDFATTAQRARIAQIAPLPPIKIDHRGIARLLAVTKSRAVVNSYLSACVSLRGSYFSCRLQVRPRTARTDILWQLEQSLSYDDYVRASERTDHAMITTLEQATDTLIRESAERPRHTHDLLELHNAVLASNWRIDADTDDLVFLNSVYRGRYPADVGLLPRREPAIGKSRDRHPNR